MKVQLSTKQVTVTMVEVCILNNTDKSYYLMCYFFIHTVVPTNINDVRSQISLTQSGPKAAIFFNQVSNAVYEQYTLY